MRMHITEYVKSIVNITELNVDISCEIFSRMINIYDHDKVDLYLKTLHDCGYIEYSFRSRPLDNRYYKVIERIPEKIAISKIVKHKKLFLRKRKLDVINKIIEND